MDDRTSDPRVRSWRGDAGLPETSLAKGGVRVTGSALDEGAQWYVTQDRFGWSTVVLVSDETGAPLPDLRPVLQLSASRSAEPSQTALDVREALGDRADHVGFALARISPHGGLLELLNVSLATVLVWHPNEGLSPYEPCHPSLAACTAQLSSEVIRLHSGGLVAMTTSGVLASAAGWAELKQFVHDMAIDPLGGTLAQADPQEIGRLLAEAVPQGPRSSPRAAVMVGQPAAQTQVA
ncbi:MAG: hypothetical protein AB8I08_18900 [Sandaracinaceae bacterium]